ncbi:hypothetical protein [Roseovarius dicentrarchi]|uniref:hypothetical protein n=1 Tax=Roseovarius dicentrarchi TaxID=2250573 RepID=UPI000DE8E9F7|nr:hypothetical protein [Roseovarius dicentrarchi]
MELLVAMMAGATGGAGLRGPSRLIPATALGIGGGAAAWYLLALIGPGLNAGPLIVIHMIAGALLGAGLSYGAGVLHRRAGG